MRLKEQMKMLLQLQRSKFLQFIDLRNPQPVLLHRLIKDLSSIGFTKNFKRIQADNRSSKSLVVTEFCEFSRLEDATGRVGLFCLKKPADDYPYKTKFSRNFFFGLGKKYLKKRKV